MSTQPQDNTPADDGQSDETTGRVADTVIRTWSVTLEELRTNIAHNTEEAQELFIWCYLWCTDPAHPMRREEFAAKVGFDHTTVLKILRGNNTHSETGVRLALSERFISGMEKFRALEQERAKAQRVPIAKTPTLIRIWNACDLARESQTPVFIIGPSHIGKSVALTSYKEDHNHGHTVYVRLQAASGLHGMVKAIAAAIGGIGLKANNATLVESIKKKLRPNMVLILDEVHELLHTYRKESFFACLEVLREIYDAVGCGFVLCGTKLLMKRIDEERGEMEQLLRRGVHKVILPDQPTKADLSVIFQSVGLAFPVKGNHLTVSVGGRSFTDDPYELLRQIGLEEGLKAITERVRYAQRFARKEKAALAWRHFVRAHFTIKQNEEPGNDWETKEAA